MSVSLRLLLAAVLLVPAAAPALATTSASAPVNDDRATPVTADALPFRAELDVGGATRSPDDPELTGLDCWPAPQRTVWYAHTPSEDVRIAADTFGSDFDTLLGVFAVSDAGLVEVACNDETPRGSQARVHLDLAAGTTYLFQVGSIEGAEGHSLVFALDIDDRPLLTGTTSVAGTATLVPRTGGAVATGTVDCTRPARLTVDFVILQGRTQAYGWSDELFCEPGGSLTWSGATVFVEGGRLRRGPAQFIARTYYQDEVDYRVVPLEADLQLVGSAR